MEIKPKYIREKVEPPEPTPPTKKSVEELVALVGEDNDAPDPVIDDLASMV